MKINILKRTQPSKIIFKRLRVAIKVLIIIVICNLLLTGCWNVVELQDLAIVSVVGIDKDPEDKGYLVSLQITNPTIVAGREGVGTGESLPVTVFTGTGKTFLDALGRTVHKIPGKIFLGHVQIFIFSEEVAREGIEDVLNYIRRDVDSRMTSRILIANGHSAMSIVRTIEALEISPAMAIHKKLKFSEQSMSKNIMVNVKDVIKTVNSKGSEPIISGVSIEGDIKKGFGKENFENTKMPATIVINGVALFKDDKLQMWIDNDYSRAILQVINKINSTVILLDCDDEKDGIAVELLFSKASIKTTLENEKPVFHVSVFQNAMISDFECDDIDLSKKEDIAKLEDQLSNQTKEEILVAIESTQKIGSDVIGFGHAFNLEHPKEWKKVEENWDDIFKEVTVEVSVDSDIRRTGMIF